MGSEIVSHIKYKRFCGWLGGREEGNKHKMTLIHCRNCSLVFKNGT